MLRGAKLYPTVAEAWVADIGVAESTRADYLNTLRRFQGRIGDDVRFEEITPEMVRDYVTTGDDGRPRADRSRAKILGAIHSVFAWAADPELPYQRIGNPAARLHADRCSRRSPRDVRRRVWLSAEQARMLVATTRGDGTDPLDQRDAVMVALYLYTGLRLAELIRIRWRQVDFSAGDFGMLVQVVRKGGKVTDIALNEAARRELFAWRARFVEAVGPAIDDLGIIPQARNAPAGGLAGMVPCANDFRIDPATRQKGQRAACPACGKEVRITAAGTLWEHGTRPDSARDRHVTIVWKQRVTAGVSVRARIIDRATQAGIGHLRPHDLRRSLAGMLDDGGADLREIQAALGHAHTITTERYMKQRTRLAPAAAALDFG